MASQLPLIKCNTYKLYRCLRGSISSSAMELWVYIGNFSHIRALLPKLYYTMADFSIYAPVYQLVEEKADK